jgi:hypothetical protein
VNAEPTRGQVIGLAIQLMREDGYDTRREPPAALLAYYCQIARSVLTYGTADLE